jgi:hypothetical protein
VWLVSALVPTPLRFWLWAAAFILDLGTPWLAIQHSMKVPPDGVDYARDLRHIRYHTFGDSSINFTVILRAREFVDQYVIKRRGLQGW